MKHMNYWLNRNELTAVTASLLLLVAGSASGALVAHYRFNGDLKDETGNHPGRPCGPDVTAQFDLGISGDALAINSADSAVEVANPSAIDFSKDFTIAAWINTAFGGEQVVVFKGHAQAFAAPDKQFNLYGPQGIFIYAAGQGNWGTGFQDPYKRVVNDGAWHHVAVTYRAAHTPHFTLFLDGNAKLPSDTGTFMGSDFILQPDAPNSVLRLGGRADNEYPFFRGLLDEVRIYDQALDLNQIQFLHQNPAGDAETKVVPHIRSVPRIQLDAGHPWRPPFGLERIGQPLRATIKIAFDRRPAPETWLAGYLQGKEIERQLLTLTGQSPFTIKIAMVHSPDELVLFANDSQGEPVELVRQAVRRPELEAEAIARPDTVINPVDLGTVLVPADWLLLVRGQRAHLEVASVCRTHSVAGAQVRAWFESRPLEATVRAVNLAHGEPVRCELPLPEAPTSGDRDILHVVIREGETKELWHKRIQTMLVQQSPQWPRFGAVATKLRYDAPISLRHPVTGALSSLKYEDGWSPSLQDVVVFLPNGSRFVFWRGSSYVPFWAGRYNTGCCYEWAETSPPPGGFVDSVEPLMDKELRYSRVEILQSTPARVHVRWTYQSCDFTYQVWGDAAAEDFYFYPDGWGTRVLTLKSAPGIDYELSEFIILTPQSAYPFNVLPSRLVDVIFMDGEKRQLQVPYSEIEQPEVWKPRQLPAVYRVRLHKDEPQTAIYFNPNDTHLPPIIFGPFYDRDSLVTPTYWGSHWPLARGKTTGNAIDDRILLTPAHNSVLSWGLKNRPTPVSTRTLITQDTLGRSKPMILQRWVWHVAMTDASDRRLLECAHSLTQPPSLELQGARLDFEAYVPERRAIRLKIEESTVRIMIKPAGKPGLKCVNPVFELLGAPGALANVALAGRTLQPEEYAWDGQTFWLNATLVKPAQLQLEFNSAPSP